MTFKILWVDGQPSGEVAFGQRFLPAGVELLGDPDGATGAPTRWAERALAADALITRYAPVGTAELAAASRIRLVQKYGGREDGIDLKAAAKAAVPVATMPLSGCIAVAECAMTLLLALSKQLLRGHGSVIRGAYRDRGLVPKPTNQHDHAFQWMGLSDIFELSGKTLGIVGFGEIGTEIASRARAFGMMPSYFKRHRLPKRLDERLGVTYKPFETLLRTSDVVMLTAPYSDETRGLIGATELALMRPNAVLVNVARGGLIDEPALVSALTTRAIAGAGLDVYACEPVPHDHPLLSLNNVVLTPHVGGGTGGARERQLRDVLGNILRVASGGQPHHLVQGG